MPSPQTHHGRKPLPTSRARLALKRLSFLARPASSSHSPIIGFFIQPKTPIMTLSHEDMDLIFRNARTQNGWKPKPVSDAQLREFYELLPKLFPHNQNARGIYAGDEKKAHTERTAFRNGSMQGGYFILAARSIGLDCGPMSGFDNAKVDAEFFSGTGIRSNFLCSLGYGDPSKVMPRSPRPAFDEVCQLL